MNSEINAWLNDSVTNRWISAATLFCIVLVIGQMARRALWSRLTKWSSASDRTWDDLLLAKLKAPITFILAVAAFGIAIQVAPAEFRTTPLVQIGTKVALVLTVVWILERLLGIIIHSSALPASLGSSTRVLLQNIARFVLMTLGLLVVLDTIGVSITPLLASLGVGSIAVALALQDTLSNFFGGLFILADRPIRIGDFVEIDGVQGFVENIGWRSTKIRQTTDVVIIVPNSKVSAAPLKNFELPEREINFLVECGIAYESDLDHVERVVLETASEIQKTSPSAVVSWEPILRFHTFADSSINFFVVMRAQHFTEIGLLRHALIKAIHKRFAKEGITIPFPQRVVQLYGSDRAPVVVRTPPH